MSVVLRNQRTRLYLSDDGQWTAERGQALRFAHTGPAFACLLEKRLPDMEVVMVFDDPRYDITFSTPLPPARGLSEPGPDL